MATHSAGFVLAAALAAASLLPPNLALGSQTPMDFAEKVAWDLAEEHFAPVVTRMSPEMAAAPPAEKLSEIWASLTHQFGAFGGLGDATSETKAGVTLVRVPVKFRTRVLDLEIAVASERIVGFFIAPHEDPAAAWTAPAYVDPSKFRDVEVRIGEEPNALPGTLSLPKGVDKAPVVILVHGSGPQHRDESVGPNRIFRDIASGLASRGVAVLRYDKRTKVYPTSFEGLKNPTVTDEVLDDVMLAFDMLKARPDIDARDIVVLGHSLGGTLAPRIAAANPGVAKIVILAGATRSLPDIAVAQTEYLASLNGAADAASAKAIEAINADAARVRAARPGDEGAPFLGAPLSYWADLNTYDPAAVADSLTLPILILQGGRDYQVTMADFDRFRSVLADHANVEMHELPRLNHLFMSGVGPSTPAEYEQPGHVDAEVIDLIANFVSKP